MFNLKSLSRWFVLSSILASTIVVAAENRTGLKGDDWYVRLIVESPAEHLYKRSNLLGQLAQSSLDYDRHDLVELAPPMAPYLTAVFTHPDREQTEGFSTDFHSPNQNDEWVFVVRTDDPKREVTLRWESTHPKHLARSYLVDLDANVAIDAGNGKSQQSYTFSMNGETERAFLWVLASETINSENKLSQLRSRLPMEANRYKNIVDSLNELPRDLQPQ